MVETQDPVRWEAYDPGGSYCEMLGRAGAAVNGREMIRERIAQMSMAELRRRSKAAERELFNLGITFTVYTKRDAIDRILPFDLIPRVLPATDWQIIETGVEQRVRALNLFLHDVYHDQKILKDGVVPKGLVLGNENYRPEMVGLDLPHQTYVHICGTDIVRDELGRFRVLEDNGRTPSGVSYVAENRFLMLRAFPDLISGLRVRPIDQYGPQLNAALSEIAPRSHRRPPDRAALARLLQLGLFRARLPGARAMVHRPWSRGATSWCITTIGSTCARPRAWCRVDVIYRRIDDDFHRSGQAFRPGQSVLGVPGHHSTPTGSWQRDALANALGTGVADDKAVYAYVPRMIKYYLDQDPIMAERRDQYLLRGTGKPLQYVLDNL